MEVSSETETSVPLNKKSKAQVSFGSHESIKDRYNPNKPESRCDAVLQFARRWWIALLVGGILLLALILGLSLGLTLSSKPVDDGGDVDHWWKNAVIYRIHVPTFQDSDGDGIGDLQGNN